MESITFDEYTELFIQRYPRYVVKFQGEKYWKSKHKPLTNIAILSHLEGKYNIGTLGRWYPEFCILDIDDRPLSYVDEIRSALGLNDSNSFICESERKDHYHIIIRPSRSNKPPTIRHLTQSFQNFVLLRGIEAYPQVKRTIRLPFGKHQSIISPNLQHLDTWNDKLYWFMKLNEYNLNDIPAQQYSLDFSYPELLTGDTLQSLQPDLMTEAQHLLEHGLQTAHSRHQSQFILLSYLARSNIPQSQAEIIVNKWIQEHHNEQSQDIIKHPRHVQDEIQRQASSVYNFYEKLYPDRTHNQYSGYICKPDIEDIIRIAGGSLPRSKFLFNLVKYSYPRRYRQFISIHRDKLISWSGTRTYLKYLDELSGKGIIKRGNAYLAGKFSKDLRLNWKYSSDQDAILFSGRAINEFGDTLKSILSPQDIRQLFQSAGAKRTTSLEIVKSLNE